MIENGKSGLFLVLLENMVKFVLLVPFSYVDMDLMTNRVYYVVGYLESQKRGCLQNHKSTPVSVLEKACYMLHYTNFYSRKANRDPMSYYRGDKLYKPRKNFLTTNWEPPPAARLKQNTNASQIMTKNLTAINYFYRDNNDCNWRYFCFSTGSHSSSRSSENGGSS